MLNFDEFIREADWIEGSAFQRMFVLMDGKEYRIKEWYPECDPEINSEFPDSRETCNHKIVFEI